MKVAPLSRSFFVISILGFIATVLYFGKLGVTWGVTLGIFFAIMFIASMISMTYAQSSEDLIAGFAAKRKKGKKSKK